MDVLLGAGANAGFTGDAFPAAQAGFLQLQTHRALLFTGIAARDAAVALPVQPRKWRHRQQGKHRSHGAEELTEEPGLHRHTQQNEHKQPDAHTKALRRQMQSRQAGKHLPRLAPVSIFSCRVTYSATSHASSRYLTFCPKSTARSGRRSCFLRWNSFF